ncbi:MAG: biopolymer transporter ExbD [Lysobacter sp.]|nr:biopolymer transporter ExbD [Lysobacter sp.]
MAFAQTHSRAVMADINITPLVDVMLVLLVIFMIATPILSHSINIPLAPGADKAVIPPDPIRLRVDGANQVFWNDTLTPVMALQNMMAAEVQRDPANQPRLEVDSSEDAEYQVLAKVLAAAKNAEMDRIAFVQK